MKRAVAALLLMPLAVLAEDDYRERSRALTERFAQQLKTELVAAMEGGGPMNAITVCRDRAPAIAANLARESGASIGRTSLKPRNPNNLHAPWQYPVLLRFDALDDEAIARDGEFFEQSPAPGIDAHYMRAIPTQAVCLTCHGKPAGDVTAALERAYPNDMATGYSVGDVRGAFYVAWPSRSRDDN